MNEREMFINVPQEMQGNGFSGNGFQGNGFSGNGINPIFDYGFSQLDLKEIISQI